MGFIANTTGYDLTAKLTPQGRRKLITNNNTLITKFSLGDSDAYYGVFEGVQGGEVPVISGYNNGSDRNNGGFNYVMRSTLKRNSSTDKKPVEAASISVNTSVEELGAKTIHYNGVSITVDRINLSGTSSDRLTNLFYSFGLPITTSEFNTYTGLTTTGGGFANTAISGLAQSDILVINMDDKEYAEIIDGKSIKLVVPTSAQTYNIYSTYENKAGSLVNEDAAVYDTSANITQFGPNRALLFSDEIQRPNGGNPSKSWATGYAQTKPFSLNGKERWNMVTNTNLLLTADTPVGIAYLDKGFLVITDQTIVNDWNEAWSAVPSTTKITFNHDRNTVSQSITCIKDRGEFGNSNNPTWSVGDTPRITEVGLFDDSDTLIAIGKLNKTYEATADDFVAFNITINY